MEKMMKYPPLEIERKYLIVYPDEALLKAQPGCRVLEMEQIYLLAEKGVTARVRRVLENGIESFYHTEKVRRSALSSYETEREIDREAYRELCKNADPGCCVIRKIRYKIPHGDLFAEIDVYPFWTRQAVLEIELPDENTVPDLPPYITVIRDVSGDKQYTNYSLAQKVPNQII